MNCGGASSDPRSIIQLQTQQHPAALPLTHESRKPPRPKNLSEDASHYQFNSRLFPSHPDPTNSILSTCHTRKQEEAFVRHLSSTTFVLEYNTATLLLVTSARRAIYTPTSTQYFGVDIIFPSPPAQLHHARSSGPDRVSQQTDKYHYPAGSSTAENLAMTGHEGDLLKQATQKMMAR